MKRSSTLALVFLLAACAMSRDAYDDFSMRVSKRNDQRLAAAFADLAKRGYPLLERDDGLSMAGLDEAGLAQCKKQRVGLGRMQPEDVVGVEVVAPGGAVTKVTANALKACTFFRRFEGELAVTGADGAAGRLVREERKLVARAPDGGVVAVSVERRVVAQHRVLVKQTCNCMPTIDPDPLELEPRIPVSWGQPRMLEQVSVQVDGEDIETSCTENVY
ncbi:MAG: hypothetical protein U0228_09105 [Myxococcaceae bacterium]